MRTSIVRARHIMVFREDEEDDWRDAANGGKWHNAACQLDEWLRTQIKHCDKDELQEARDKLYELVEGSGISLWD